jgi:hypothetical protein
MYRVLPDRTWREWAYDRRLPIVTRGKGEVSAANHLGFRCVQAAGNARECGVL